MYNDFLRKDKDYLGQNCKNITLLPHQNCKRFA